MLHPINKIPLQIFIEVHSYFVSRIGKYKSVLFYWSDFQFSNQVISKILLIIAPSPCYPFLVK